MHVETAKFVLSTLQAAVTHLEEEEERWPAWKVAVVFAILTGSSLPLGAACGIWMTSADTGGDQSERIEADNVRRAIVAYSLAFGAGALLFAVTVELYGEAMRELEEDGYINGSIEVLVMVASAMLGAFIYTFLNRWLENFLLEDEHTTGEEFLVVHEASPLVGLPPALGLSVPQKQLSARRRRLSVVDGAAASPGQQSHCRARSAASFMLLDQIRGASNAGPPSLPESVSSRHPLSPRDARPSSSLPVGQCCGADRKPTPRKGTPAQTAAESLAAAPSGKAGRATLEVVQELSPRTATSESECESSSGRSEIFDGGAPRSEQRPPEHAPPRAGAPSGRKSALMVGMATWLGVCVDALPEGVLLGFLAAEGRLSAALVVSLFLANFPEAFSSASLLREARKPAWAILGLWTLLLVLTAGLAGLAALAYPRGDAPFHWRLALAAIEGVAGGAMLACIAAVMLPQAYHLQGDAVGVLVVAGFITSVLVRLFGGVVSEHTVNLGPQLAPSHHAFLAAWH